MKVDDGDAALQLAIWFRAVSLVRTCGASSERASPAQFAVPAISDAADSWLEQSSARTMRRPQLSGSTVMAAETAESSGYDGGGGGD